MWPWSEYEGVSEIDKLYQLLLCFETDFFPSLPNPEHSKLEPIIQSHPVPGNSKSLRSLFFFSLQTPGIPHILPVLAALSILSMLPTFSPSITSLTPSCRLRDALPKWSRVVSFLSCVSNTSIFIKLANTIKSHIKILNANSSYKYLRIMISIKFGLKYFFKIYINGNWGWGVGW